MLVLYVLIRYIHDPVPKCMLFANDIVIIEETKVNNGDMKIYKKRLRLKDNILKFYNLTIV